MNIKRNANGFEIIKDEDNKLIFDILKVAVIYFTIASIFAVLVDAFQLEKDVKVEYISMLAVVAVIYLIMQRIERKIIATTIILGCWIVVMLFNKEAVVSGIAPFVNSYISLRNSFYNEDYALMTANSTSTDILLAMILLQIIFSLIFVLIMQKKKLWIVALAIILLPVIFSATVGEMPSVFSAECLLISASMYLICYHSQGKTKIAELGKAAIILGFVFLVAMLIQPAVEGYKKSHITEYKEIKKTLVEGQQNFSVEDMVSEIFNSEDNYAKGGIGKGNLANLSKVEPQGTKDLEVIVSEKPLDRVYLKAFVGTEYTGEKWEEMDSSEMYDIIKDELDASDRRILMNMPFTIVNDLWERSDIFEMTVNILEASDEFGYSPYYAEISEDEEVVLDSYIDGKGKDSHHYRYYDLSNYIIFGFDTFDYYFDGTVISPRQNILWMNYNENFVGAKYRKHQNELAGLKEYCEDFDTSDVDAISAEIDNAFRENLTYDTSPGANPSDKDFVEYFLLENQKGFCVHFASAATLIYRMCGVPARYVEGYAIPTSAFVEQSDGTYKAIVTDEMAHAWCEVIDMSTVGIGWHVREHTLTYLDDSQAVANSDYPEKEETTTTAIIENVTTKQPETTVQQVTTKGENGETATTSVAGDDGEQKPGSTPKKTDVFSVIKNIVSILIIPVILILLAAILWKARWRRKIHSFKNRKHNVGISNTYNEICKICSFTGLKQERLSDRQMIEQIKEIYNQLEKEEWDWIYNCAERATFAEEKIEAEEYKEMWRLYRKFRNAIAEELKGVKKLWFIVVKAM